jgi:hypothetical protein
VTGSAPILPTRRQPRPGTWTLGYRPLGRHERRGLVTERPARRLLHPRRTHHHRRGSEVERQRAQIALAADRLGLRMADESADVGYSGLSMDRPNLRRLLDHVAVNRVGFCVVATRDRLSEDPEDMADIDQALDDALVAIVIAADHTRRGLHITGRAVGPAAGVDLLLRSVCSPCSDVGALMVESLALATGCGSERVRAGDAVAVSVGGDGADVLFPCSAPYRSVMVRVVAPTTGSLGSLGPRARRRVARSALVAR